MYFGVCWTPLSSSISCRWLCRMPLSDVTTTTTAIEVGYQGRSSYNDMRTSLYHQAVVLVHLSLYWNSLAICRFHLSVFQRYQAIYNSLTAVLLIKTRSLGNQHFIIKILKRCLKAFDHIIIHACVRGKHHPPTQVSQPYRLVELRRLWIKYKMSATGTNTKRKDGDISSTLLTTRQPGINLKTKWLYSYEPRQFRTAPRDTY